MDLGNEWCQALRAYADGVSDAQTAYACLTRLGPALDVSGNVKLMDLWEQGFTLLSEVNHGDVGESRAAVARLIS